MHSISFPVLHLVKQIQSLSTDSLTCWCSLFRWIITSCFWLSSTPYSVMWHILRPKWLVYYSTFEQSVRHHNTSTKILSFRDRSDEPYRFIRNNYDSNVTICKRNERRGNVANICVLPLRLANRNHLICDDSKYYVSIGHFAKKNWIVHSR